MVGIGSRLRMVCGLLLLAGGFALADDGKLLEKPGRYRAAGMVGENRADQVALHGLHADDRGPGLERKKMSRPVARDTCRRRWLAWM